ncbi:hypothetical protein BJ508DRAFT_199409, partial [Ascobolus immersus RN42]
IDIPKYELLSDRRGGRTAWSARVTLTRQVGNNRYAEVFQADFWYDGSQENNAYEDAARVAFQKMGRGSPPMSPLAT